MPEKAKLRGWILGNRAKGKERAALDGRGEKG